MLALLALSAAFVPVRLPAQVNLVQNGSFGGGFNNGPSGWTSSGVGLFLGYAGEAAEGDVNFANIEGGGFLYQYLDTIPGQIYDLRFAMAGNINWPGLITMNTLWDGNNVRMTTWNPTGHTFTNLGWIYTDVEVLATSSLTQLEFENLGQAEQQPFLDAVSVTIVPEASTSKLLGTIALPAFLLFRRSRADSKVSHYYVL